MTIIIPNETELINWNDALNQCSGDVEFLKELLIDMREEFKSSVLKLSESVTKGDMFTTQCESHSIKGTSSNMMCHRLVAVSLYMEEEGKKGTQLKEGSKEYDATNENIQKAFKVLLEEVTRFEDMINLKCHFF